MFETVLLFGLVALFVGWRRTVARLRVLEERVAELADAQVASPAPTIATRADRVEVPDPEPVAQTPEILVDSSPLAELAFEEDRSPAQAPARETPALENSARETMSGLFERFVGGRLLVWTGAIAIALSGLFLVRYSIELGLIGPRVRMIAAGVFGAALVLGGEIARRRIPGDLRIGQALVGAGVLVLYAAAYGSHILYGLITLTTAFVLMAAIAAGALGLSLRHGTPTAALGLVGGFVTPLLVGRSTGEAAPLLIYLTLLNLAVLAVAVRSRRPWLGWAAKLATLGWTASLLASAPDDALLIAAFLLVHTVATGLAWRDEAWKLEPVPSLGPTLALAQMGAAVPLADYRPEAWSLLLAFGVAGYALGGRSRVLAAVPARALIAALLLLAGQVAFAPTQPVLPWAVATTVLFAGGSWRRLGEDFGRLAKTLTFCIAVAVPALILRIGAAALLPDLAWRGLFAALALAPAALAWRMRGSARVDGPFDRPLLLCGATFGLLLASAMRDLVPALWTPSGFMLVALALAAGGRRIADGGIMRLSMIALGGALVAAASLAQPILEMLVAATYGVPALTGALPPIGGLHPAGAALVLFAVPGASAWAIRGVVPVRETEVRRIAGIAAGVLAGLTLYMLYKQLFDLRTPADFVARGFAERTLLTQGLFFAGWLLLKRPRLAWLAMPALVLTAAAAARFVWFDVVVLNPVAVRQDVGAWPGLILVAYGGAAFWLWEARRRAAAGAPAAIGLALFLTAAVVGAGMLVRQIYHGAILVGGEMGRAEFYGYSLAGLLLSVGLLIFGARRGDTPLRVAGLALLTATVVKVFVFDAAALEGLLRIASFAGLGAALIGMGKLYGTVLGRSAPKADPVPS